MIRPLQVFSVFRFDMTVKTLVGRLVKIKKDKKKYYTVICLIKAQGAIARSSLMT